MNPDGPLSRVLYVDLGRRGFRVENREDLFEDYLGGAGVAINLLLEECPRNADPLGPENPIILAIGPFVGAFPLASKTVAMFKSPLTGNLGESHAGGRSAVAIRMAGYGAIVIKGASETPIYLAVHGDRVRFRDASAVWGMRSSYTVGRVIRELEPGAGLRTIMRIGKAGERLVSYANVITETYRHFGRLGLGAVFGSKKLKAMVVSGGRSVPVSDMRLYRKVYDEVFDKAVKSPLMKKYHDLGTALNVEPLNRLRALPTRNLRQASFDEVSRISGETLAEKYLGRRVACAHCPVACIHIAALREPYATEPYFYKTTMISYDYEPLYALGSMLGISDADGWLKLMDEVEVEGLDAISTGVVLAWATEALERGVIDREDTAGLDLRWGDHEAYVEAVKLIVRQPNEFYEALARGVDYASSRYGGSEFALALGGLEMAGYHTGPICYITYLTGSRHSHLDSAGYGYDQKALAAGRLPDPEEAAEGLLKEEAWRQILSSLVVCFFSRGIYHPKIVLKALEAVGSRCSELDEEGLREVGLRILRKKFEFKVREGFDPGKLKSPRRVFEVPTPHGRIHKEYLDRAVEVFYTLLKGGKE